MKLLSLRGSEPSKVSGSLTLVTGCFSRRRSSCVMSVIASAKFGEGVSEMMECCRDSGSGWMSGADWMMMVGSTTSS